MSTEQSEKPYNACIFQAEYGFFDVELTRMIQEHPYFQCFCGYKAYGDSKPPFDPSLMVYFRKHLTPEILGEINEMILAAKNADADDHSDDGGNGGTMIVDATCAPAQIKYPQDSALLNEARGNTEALIDALHRPGEKNPRTYRKCAHKDYLALVRTRKPGTIRRGCWRIKSTAIGTIWPIAKRGEFGLPGRICGRFSTPQ